MPQSRRKAREDAVQVLYQLDMNQDMTPEAGLYHFENHFMVEKHEMDPFTQRLVSGVTEHIREIDRLIAETSENWRPERMPLVDRNVLRVGVFELLYCDDIPATVTINEMIEVARHFGSENSASFINGILDKIRLLQPRPGKAP